MFMRAQPAATTAIATTARTGLLHRFSVALALRRQRRSLLALDAHMLRDIGLTPEQARAEAALPFWPAPDHWAPNNANACGAVSSSGIKPDLQRMNA